MSGTDPLKLSFDVNSVAQSLGGATSTGGSGFLNTLFGGATSLASLIPGGSIAVGGAGLALNLTSSLMGFNISDQIKTMQELGGNLTCLGNQSFTKSQLQGISTMWADRYRALQTNPTLQDAESLINDLSCEVSYIRNYNVSKLRSLCSKKLQLMLADFDDKMISSIQSAFGLKSSTSSVRNWAGVDVNYTKYSLNMPQAQTVTQTQTVTNATIPDHVLTKDEASQIMANDAYMTSFAATSGMGINELQTKLQQVIDGGLNVRIVNGKVIWSGGISASAGNAPQNNMLTFLLAGGAGILAYKMVRKH